MSTPVPSEQPPPPRFNLTGTRVAEYFRFACERQLRYDLVSAAERGVERTIRPGARLLSAAGRGWERRKVRELLRRFGGERIAFAGWTEAGGPARIPAATVVQLLRAPGELEVLVQPELRLSDPERFASRYGLDARRLRVASAVPDVIRVRRLSTGRRLFQIIDIKASAKGRIPHYAQIAYYSLLLDEICAQEGIESGTTDRRWGRVWSRGGRGPARFPLAAYRHHVEEVLRRDVPRVLEQEQAESAWHLSPRCAGCGYFGHCRGQADGGDDLARVVGITPLAKRVLRGKGVGSVRDLALKARKGTYQGCHALEAQAQRLDLRARALTYGKVLDVEQRTHLMPPDEDVRVIVSGEGDPVSGRCFALGLKVESARPLADAPTLGVWVSDAGTLHAERAILQSLLAALERVLHAVDAGGPRGAGRGRGESVHFYVYDRAELDLLRELLLRHLPDARSRPAIARLLRVLSPRTVAAQAGALGSTPGTVVADVAAALFALPVPYAYDLAAVSDRLRPAERGAAWRPPAEYAWPFSSQVAFERIHDVWRRPAAEAEPVREAIRAAVTGKLVAIDSVIRAVRERSRRRDRLQMRKEPFRAAGDEAPLADAGLESMRLLTEMESAAEAAGLQALHVLPSEERARRFECIRGLSLAERRDDGTLVFSFDDACRDSKFRPGDFNLVLTNQDERSLLEADRQPWKRRHLSMELVSYDLEASPPRVALSPGGDIDKAEAEGWIDLGYLCVLDRAPGDFGTERVLATLAALDAGRGEAGAVLALLRGERPAGWPAHAGEADDAFAAALEPAARALGRPVLNEDQERAWRRVFDESLSLVWGPPGTGKTYLLAWMLVGLAAAARRAGRPCRMLVTAATHRAVANVLARVGREVADAGVAVPLRLAKLRGSGSEADPELEGAGIDLAADGALPGLLADADAGGVPLVVGSTVWSLWKQMRRVDSAESEEGVPVASWFDVVVIDEASQMKVPEALIALSSLRRGGRVILCGDDRQLAPVLRGRYGDDAGTLFGSAFGHFASHTPPSPLRESRRMSEALVAYPRRLFYPGLFSAVPGRRVALAPADLEPDDAALRDLFLAPRDAVVLCTYRGVRATARNAFEARLAARIARLARALLLDPATGDAYTDAAFVAEGFAILSPHRAQNGAILAEIGALGMRAAEAPVVDTVERMQGNERDVVLVSYAVADREYAEAEAGFLLNPNRFNVAITRARAKLILLVSEEVLDAVPTDETVLDGSMALKGYVAHCRDGARDFVLPAPDGAPVRLRCRYRALRD